MTDDAEPEIESSQVLLQESSAPAAEAESPGRMLRSARERAGMSIEALSASTTLNVSIVERLEGDRFGDLPQPVFVRGYYRKCAKALGIPEQTLVDVYARCAGAEMPRVPAVGQVDVVPRDVTPHGPRLLMWLAAIALLVVAFALVWFWLPGALSTTDGRPAASMVVLDHAVTADAGATQQPRQPSPAARSEAPPAVGDSGAVDARADAAIAEAGASPEVATSGAAADDVSDDAVSSAARPGQTGPSPAGNDSSAADSKAEISANKLVLTFKQRSWVRVRDGSGSVLLEGLVEGDNQRVLQGELPYDVVLGYAPGVEVALGGQSIDLSGRIADNNTAEFTLQAGDR